MSLLAPDIDSLPRHPATTSLTALEILKTEEASHGKNAELGLRGLERLGDARSSARCGIGGCARDPAAQQALTDQHPAAAAPAIRIGHAVRLQGTPGPDSCGFVLGYCNVWPPSVRWRHRS
jgi:hypothetical protein